MRPILWLLSIGGALGAAYGLYHLEHEVQTMERELAQLQDAGRRNAEASQVLQAEWSYLNRPERLQELAARHLVLMPSTIRQIVAKPQLLAALPLAAPSAEDTEALERVELAAIPIPSPKPLPPRAAAAATGLPATSVLASIKIQSAPPRVLPLPVPAAFHPAVEPGAAR
jgi:hypothetical protein